MVSIFIKTHARDYPFLSLCIQSITKYVSGNFDVVIVYDSCDTPPIMPPVKANIKIKIIAVDKVGDGYLFQQYVKIKAYEYTDAEYIMFVDSDCIFNKPVNINEFVGESPIMIYTPYEKVGDAICWKKPTEKILQRKVDYEFMRRMPLTYHRSTLIDFVEQVKVDLLPYILQSKGFSEFNALGAYAYYFGGGYTFINSETEPLPETILIQGWTWGNEEQTNEWINKFKAILND